MQILAKLPQVRVSHVFREVNKCADWLAKWGSVMKEDFVVFEFPFTAELETLVAKDNSGLCSCFVGFYMNSLSTKKNANLS